MCYYRFKYKWVIKFFEDLAQRGHIDGGSGVLENPID